MRILVSGAEGQVGRALTQVGTEKNMELISLGRNELDVTDPFSINSAFKKYTPDLLINASAYTDVDKSETESELAYLINKDAVAYLANECLKASIPMFHISTDYVFDGSKHEAYKENDIVNPLGVYGKSKEAGEAVLRKIISEHIILRTSWVFGVDGKNFLKTIFELSKERNRLKVVSDQFGGPSSARSIAITLLSIAEQYNFTKEVNWGTYHFCQQPYVSWYQFADEIISCAMKMNLVDHLVKVEPISSIEYPTQVTRPQNSRLDTKKIEQTFGIYSSNWLTDTQTILDSLNKQT